jgi:hypothetical protein
MRGATHSPKAEGATAAAPAGAVRKKTRQLGGKGTRCPDPVLIPHAQATQRHTWQEAAGAISQGPKAEREASTAPLRRTDRPDDARQYAEPRRALAVQVVARLRSIALISLPPDRSGGNAARAQEHSEQPAICFSMNFVIPPPATRRSYWSRAAMVTGHGQARRPATSCRLFNSLCFVLFGTAADHRGTALLRNPLLSRRQLAVLTAPSPKTRHDATGCRRQYCSYLPVPILLAWRRNQPNRPDRRVGISTGSPERHGGTAPSKLTTRLRQFKKLPHSSKSSQAG